MQLYALHIKSNILQYIRTRNFDMSILAHYQHICVEGKISSILHIRAPLNWIYTKRILYNISVGENIFTSKTDMLTYK